MNLGIYDGGGVGEKVVLMAFLDPTAGTALCRARKKALRRFNGFMDTDMPAQAIKLLLNYGMRAAETLVALYGEHLLITGEIPQDAERQVEALVKISQLAKEMKLINWALPSPTGRLTHEKLVALCLMME